MLFPAGQRGKGCRWAWGSEGALGGSGCNHGGDRQLGAPGEATGSNSASDGE